MSDKCALCGNRCNRLDPLCPECNSKLDYHIKASLVLQDSDKATWGIIKDTEGNLDDWQDNPAVGAWSRAPYDGLIHIMLAKPVEALVDKAILVYQARLRKSQPELISGRHKPRMHSPTPVVNNARFDSLQAKLDAL